MENLKVFFHGGGGIFIFGGKIGIPTAVDRGLKFTRGDDDCFYYFQK